MSTKPKDTYYERSEISNSDLTSLFYRLYPQLNWVSEEAKQQAFHLGTLVDALVTEPEKINFYKLTVDDEQYTKEEFAWGKKMLNALKRHAKKDKFLDYVLKNAETQRFFVNPNQEFQQGCFNFTLKTRCKFDWWLGDSVGFGGDLKTCAATTYDQFLKQVDFVNWDRSRVWYMMLTESLNPSWGQQDFIYAVSKTNQKVFFLKIKKGDEIYERGKKKVLELAFKAWMMLV